MKTQPEFKSTADVKLSSTTKKRIAGTDPACKADCGCKKAKKEKYTNQFK